MKKMLIGTLVGVAAATGAVYSSASIIQKREDKLLEKYQAEEIFEQKKKFYLTIEKRLLSLKLLVFYCCFVFHLLLKTYIIIYQTD